MRRSSFRYQSLFVVPLVALVAGACSSNSPDPGTSSSSDTDPNPDTQPAIVKVDVFLSSTRVEVVDYQVGDTTADPESALGHELRWEVWSPDSKLVAFDTVTDPRFVRAEFGSDGKPVADAAGETRGGAGIFSVHVPHVGGQLVLLEPDGGGFREVGRTNLPAPSTDGVGQSAQPLLDPAVDIIGAPVQLVNHGAGQTRINIVIVPDGYTKAELPKFHADADNLVKGLAAVRGFHEYWKGFNIWRQDVQSRESGVGRMDTGEAPDTAFNMTHGSDVLPNAPFPARCIMFSPGVEQDALKALDIIRARTLTNYVIVLVNDDDYGGCAQPWNNLATGSRDAMSVRVMAHELGHAIFKLADEYGGNGYNSNGKCAAEAAPNISDDFKDLPWKDMTNTTQIPTPEGVSGYTIGAFEGAGYCDKGVYRPQQHCMMRDLTDDFCDVCTRELGRAFEALQPKPRPCSASCCDGSIKTGDQVDSNQCIFWVGSACNSVGGPMEIRYDNKTVWSGSSCPSMTTCTGVCCDGTSVSPGDSFDKNLCTLLTMNNCGDNGGVENAYFDGIPGSPAPNSTCEILPATGSNCAALCCDGTTQSSGVQPDSSQCTFWGGSACGTHQGPVYVKYKGNVVWDNGAQACSTLKTCSVQCNDGSVQSGGTTFDKNICVFFNTSKCDIHGGAKCVKFGGSVVSGSCP